MKSLFVKQFVDEGLGNSSYLIASKETGIAAVIDPQRDVDKYLQVAHGQGLRLAYALDTHLHADFISGSHEIAHHVASDRQEPFRIGASATGEVEFQHLALHEEDQLSLGNLCIKVLTTPGHTPEHISFAVYAEEETTPGALFSGGSLIVGGTGRPDLLGHEHTVPLAHDLYHTLQNKLALLPDEVVVYPTHGAGSFCNTTSNGARFTTIGEERRTNPFFQLHEEEAFVRRAITGLSSYPTYYRYLRDINQKGGRVLAGIPVLQPLSPESVRQQIAQGAVVIDVRATEQFLAGHIPDSYGIPLETPLVPWAGWVVPFGSPIILVADTLQEQKEAVRQLIRIGYDDLRGYLGGGMKAWEEREHAVQTTPSITVDELRNWTQDKDAPYVLDVRQTNEWNEGHLRGARHIEGGRVRELARDLLRPDRPLVVHCAHGNRSTVAISVLEQMGFRNLYALEAGYQAWEEAGYEVVKDDLK